MKIFYAIVILFISAILIKAILNGYRFWRLRALERDYQDYIRAFENQTASWDFHEKTSEIRELLINAGQHSSEIPGIENLGVGFVQVSIDVFDNMTANDQRVATFMLSAFKGAIGVYRKRIYDSFNPIYWIEFLIFLPQNIIEYILGKNANEVPRWLIRFFNVVYWIVTLIASIITIIDFVNKMGG